MDRTLVLDPLNPTTLLISMLKKDRDHPGPASSPLLPLFLLPFYCTALEHENQDDEADGLRRTHGKK